MSHRNARLTPLERRLLVDHVQDGQPVSHVAKAMGVPRQCAHRWINRHAEAGDDGLEDRSSRLHPIANRNLSDVEERALAARRERRSGPDRLAPDVLVPARTVTRILRRNGMPRPRECDPSLSEAEGPHRPRPRQFDGRRPHPHRLLQNPPRREGDSGGGLIARVGEFLAMLGISIERVITDDHWRYRDSHTVREAIADPGAVHKCIGPHCHW